MTLKRSKALAKFLTMALVLISTGIFATLMLPASPALSAANDFPVLHYAGVIPAQWEKDGSWSDLSMVQRTINRDFSEAVRNSHRFVVLNDDLVSSLWNSPAGRKELATDYELQVFTNLTMSSRGDMVVMTTRLLSPNFDTWLQESEVVARIWLIESSREQVLARLGDLIHRMINRLPVDAHVTSVNGEFVTLSAGLEQSVAVGDEFDVLTAKLETLHPANGSWLTFSTSRAGKVKVIETKGKSSIAKITSLTHENSVAVGQGILIEAISGRSRFARPDEKETFANAQTGPVVTSPVVKPGLVQIQPDEPVAATPAPKVETKEATKTQPADYEAPKSEETPPEEEAGSGMSSAAILDTLAPKGTDLEAYAGLRSWSIGGSAAAAASLPFWLINSGGLTVKRPLSEAIVLDYGLDLGYGTTTKGSFFGYGVRGSGVYIVKAKLFDGADHMFGGLQASINSISVGGESSGGYDMTTVSLLAGVGGKTKSELIGDKLDWKADVLFGLQESGQFGVSGKMNSIRSGRGLRFRFHGYVGDRPKEGYQWGGAFEFASSNYSLARSKSATYNEMSLLGLMRWTL